jgi:hypothetical protein
MRIEHRYARCEAGHEIVVQIEGYRIVAAAERTSPDDTWRFVSCGFCPVCGAGIILEPRSKP